MVFQTFNPVTYNGANLVLQLCMNRKFQEYTEINLKRHERAYIEFLTDKRIWYKKLLRLTIYAMPYVYKTENWCKRFLVVLR